MSDQPYLVTTCNFRGKDFVVKMNIIKRNSIEVRVTDKCTSEEWHCTYDVTYIENLTHKTGNYKQFDIFATMLKSGLLKTSECVTLDLLTFDDLEALRNRRATGRCNTPHASHILTNTTSNRRYLILTYTVEFDRIHYPLPLEYCGLPDPQVLQANIRKLEQEVSHLQTQLAQKQYYVDGDTTEHLTALENTVQELASENKKLKLEIKMLNDLLDEKQNSVNKMDQMYKALQSLEDQVRIERTSLQKQIFNLRQDKSYLVSKLQEVLMTENNLQKQLSASSKSPLAYPVDHKNSKDISPHTNCRQNISSKRNKFLPRKPETKQRNATSCPGFKTLRMPSHSYTSESSSDERHSRRKLHNPLKARGSRSSSARSHDTEKSKCSCKNQQQNSKQSENSPNQQYCNTSLNQQSVTSSTCFKNSYKKLNDMSTSKHNMCCGTLTHSMSDLETRILALQRLLRDGLLMK